MIFRYENGRVLQQGEGRSTCAVAINTAKHSDNGKWTCQISYNDAENNFITAKSDIEVTVTGKKFKKCDIL